MCELHEERPATAPATPGVSSFVDELVVAITNSRIYGLEHPRVRSSVESLAGTLAAQCKALDREALILGAADGYLFFDRRPLLAASRSTPRLLAILADLGSGGITFSREAQADDLEALIRFLRKEKGADCTVDQANVALARLGCRHVRFLGGYDVHDEEEVPEDFAGSLLSRPDAPPVEPPDEVLEVPLHLHRRIFDHLTDVTMRVVRGDALNLDETRAAVARILAQLQEDSKAMLSVTHYQVSEADQFQFRHSIRVACIALDFARRLTQDTELLHRIGMSALLHDVGKARVPFAVLHSRTRLSREEFAEMARHPDHGARILLELADPDPLAVTVSFMHHRTMDGGGYPSTIHKLPSQEISYATRLVKICDVYEALTGYRPYRDAISPVRAYRTMLAMGEHFDRALLHRFIRVNGAYPAGTRVALDTGEVACVEEQTEVLDRPEVIVEGRWVDRGGERLFEPCDPVRRSLLVDPDPGSIVEVIPSKAEEEQAPASV